jgi:hypothetical protein
MVSYMKYKRLAGSRRGFGKWHTLWLGDDHLLSVESTGYSEEYKRYYLKDIQAITSCRSAGGKLLNGIFGTIVAISLLAGIGGYENGPTPVCVFAGIFGGVFLLLLLWNLFRGPTCRCHIRTPVGIDKLPALDRVRSVKKALERVCPLIGRLQGEVSRKVIAELTGKAKDEPPASLDAKPVKAMQPAGPAGENPLSPYQGGMHRAVFLLLIADAGITFLQMFHNSKPLVFLSTFVCTVFFCLAIISLVRQHNHPVSEPAKWMTWGGVATMVSGSAIGYFFMIFLNIEKLKGVTSQEQIFDFYAAIEPAKHPSYAAFLLIYAVIAAVIGIGGLFALGRGPGTAESRRA